jgi:hypothetical protein
MKNQQINDKSVNRLHNYSNAIYMLDLRVGTKPSLKKKIGHLVIGIAATALLLSIVAFAILKTIGGSSSLEQNVKWIEVNVEQGQTFWSLIQDNQPTNSKVDIRDLIDIAIKHHKNGTALQAGEVVSIPVYKEVSKK